jgi:hypothetical protein
MIKEFEDLQFVINQASEVVNNCEMLREELDGIKMANRIAGISPLKRIAHKNIHYPAKQSDIPDIKEEIIVRAISCMAVSLIATIGILNLTDRLKDKFAARNVTQTE